MKIAIIGTSGFVGSALLNEALLRNLDVLSITRNKDKISNKNLPSVSSLSIDIYNVEALTKALSGVNIVISAFNAGWRNPNLYNDNMQGFQDIENASKLADVERLIMIGGAGTLKVDGKQLVDNSDFPSSIVSGARSCRDYFNVLKNDIYLNWTYFAPAPEMNPNVNTGRTGNYRLGSDSPVTDENGISRISVEDTAVAVLDEVNNKQFIKKLFTAAY
ncbi:NAD(P)H-binding protein [Apibacter raozihei]|uniref:NAD(P)-dependent oxidoreductase n=1 Tax=Apibacter TaxID=1778601 RepID=UPI0015F2E428|nr:MULTISPECIES: NAD(P)H-binding protein [Apibacter]